MGSVLFLPANFRFIEQFTKLQTTLSSRVSVANRGLFAQKTPLSTIESAQILRLRRRKGGFAQNDILGGAVQTRRQIGI